MRRAGQTRRAEKCEASAMGSKELQHFLYPLNPDSGYYLESHGQQFKTSLVGFADYLNRSDGEPSEWRLHANHRKIGPGDMVWAYFTSPTSAIGAAGYVLDWPHWNADWDSWAISIGWDNKLTEKLRKSPIPYRSFEQRVLFFAVRANTTTRRVLEDFLEAHSNTVIENASKPVERSNAQSRSVSDSHSSEPIFSMPMAVVAQSLVVPSPSLLKQLTSSQLPQAERTTSTMAFFSVPICTACSTGAKSRLPTTYGYTFTTPSPMLSTGSCTAENSTGPCTERKRLSRRT